MKIGSLALIIAFVGAISFIGTAKADILHFELTSQIASFNFDLDRQPTNAQLDPTFPNSFFLSNVTITNTSSSLTSVVPFLTF
ncbi:MAG: hypothetical protein ABI925_13045, partial [Verrucomicrobiota bacterium]